MNITPHKLKGVFEATDRRKMMLFTKSFAPGAQEFGDQMIVRQDGAEYREWSPMRSKFAAAIARGLQQQGIKEGSVVLYLGASHGLTPSHVSDIVGSAGFVFCLDFAPRVVRDLVFVCEARENMAPLLADAKQPDSFKEKLPAEGVDVVYQDVAQKGQVEIFLKNCDAFLKKGGYGLLALKARSEDVTARPHDVFRMVRQKLESRPEYVVVDYRELDPFEKDHAFFAIKKR